MSKNYYQLLILCIASFLSAFFIAFFYRLGLTLAYGDAESHLNIAKRVVDSLTPGLAQLGGIWLPLPHLLMIPFIIPDSLWRTGLGGSIVSGIFFVVTCIFIYKCTVLITKSHFAGFVSFLLFGLNTNVLFLQATPMGELPLLAFSSISIYAYFLFIKNDANIFALIMAAFFGFCATLTRYDGWFLVLIEAIGIIILYLKRPFRFRELQGKIILFATLAFFGIAMWFAWDGLILGNMLYFTNSPFSAKSQQQSWLAKNELVTYKNLALSFLYYAVDALENIGVLTSITALIGLVLFLFDRKITQRWIIALILLVPFLFYVVTLYMGQSVIFIPTLTPKEFDWHLFNVRYGVMLIPFVAFFFGYIFAKSKNIIKPFIFLPLIIQSFLFFSGQIPTLTLQDAQVGLSASRTPDAQLWLKKHYDNGLVLLDDYARTVSITKSNLPIQNVIYIGNKPYWQKSLDHPEKYVKWVVLQKNDAVWKALYDNPIKQAELYKYYEKAYTSPNILIFKRNAKIARYILPKKRFALT